MTTLLVIDNYDSFTYNLVHYCHMRGADTQVFRNDAIGVQGILHKAEAGEIDGILISPGPCSPEESGVSLPIVTAAAGVLPVFGVCLGHEAIMQAFGGKIIRVPPVHGKTSLMYHNGACPLFAGLPSPFAATRYHSLAADESTLPDCLAVTARAENADTGLIMGLRHNTHPVFGVQFHPESIASEYGHEMVGNFLNIVAAHKHYPRKPEA